MVKEKQKLRRGPKLKPDGEKKVTLVVGVKRKHLAAAKAAIANIYDKYGKWTA